MSNLSTSHIADSQYSPDMQYHRADVPSLSRESELVIPVDFSRKRTAFFMTGPVNPDDISWILGKISPCSRIIVHQWINEHEEGDNFSEKISSLGEHIDETKVFWSIDQDLDKSIRTAVRHFDKDLIDSWQPVLSRDRVSSINSNAMRVIRRLGEFLNQDNLNKATRLVGSGMVLKNALINLPRLGPQKTTQRYIDKHQGIPSVVVSAGPSLGKQLDLLREYQDHFYIIAVDSLWELLTSKNIVPDVLVALDPKNKPKWDQELFSPETQLFADVGCSPELVNSLSRQNLIACHRPDISRLIMRLGGNIETFQTGGSVATSAFNLAVKLNSNPIILVGQDLALTDGKDHVEGYSYKMSEERLQKRSETGFDVEGYYGEKVRTMRQFLHYKNWFEARVKELSPSRLIINSTEGGAKINGAHQIPFNQVCEELRISKIYKRRDPSQVQDFDEQHLATVIGHLRAFLDLTKDFKVLGKKGHRLIESSKLKGRLPKSEKIDNLNQKIKDFDGDVKLLFDIFGGLRLESIRKSAKNLDKSVDSENSAFQKYQEIYQTIIDNADYIESRLSSLIIYFESLMKERKFYIPELANKVWD